jgi:hypothetical protein
MPKKNDELPNPGLSSTIWIEPTYISDMASSFSEIAISLSQKWVDPHSVETNVIYTNALLALELFFKSQLVVRKNDPAYVDVSSDTPQLTDEESYYNANSSVVAIHHSRLIVPQQYRTHDVEKLFSYLSSNIKEIIITEVVKETRRINNEPELVIFLGKIKNFFVDKRYDFEFFKEAVPKDSNYIHTLIPVLKGVKRAIS